MRPKIASFKKLQERYFCNEVESFQIDVTAKFHGKADRELELNRKTQKRMQMFLKDGNNESLFVSYYSGHGGAGTKGSELSGYVFWYH